ncbi:MAG: sugar phosphate nucleotidyltransferase [Candidatus Aminicenantes bacterium]|jgi:ADP-glucose pyrophosphorylase
MVTISDQGNILVVVLAGGEGRRLLPLTATRTKPAVTIGAKYRLIDIPLSNAANSGLHKCLVLTQGKDKSLNWHIKNTPFIFTDDNTETYFLASMGIYAFKTKSLFKSLRIEGERFGEHIIPRILPSIKTVAYNYNENNIIMDRRWVQYNDMLINEVEKSSDSDYWRDVGTIAEYFQANMDLAGITPRFNLYGEKWPFFTRRRELGPAKIIHTRKSEKIESAIVGEGCILSNVKGRSIVVSPLAYIDRSELENVIIFQSANIQKCRIKNTIEKRGARQIFWSKNIYRLIQDPNSPTISFRLNIFTYRLFYGKRVEFYQVFGYIISMVTRKQIKKKGKKQPDYDSAWKDIIEEHFEPFLEFFFPHIHKDIDFTKSPEILSLLH